MIDESFQVLKSEVKKMFFSPIYRNSKQYPLSVSWDFPSWHPLLLFFSPSCSNITATICVPPHVPCYRFNSSLLVPSTAKRSERILESHQLPSPLDIVLMNWRAHIWHNGGRKWRCDVHRENETEGKVSESDRRKDVSGLVKEPQDDCSKAKIS